MSALVRLLLRVGSTGYVFVSLTTQVVLRDFNLISLYIRKSLDEPRFFNKLRYYGFEFITQRNQFMRLFPSLTYSAIVVSRELAVTYPVAKLLFLSDSSIHETGGGGLSPKVKHRAILEVVFSWFKRKTSEDTVSIVKEMLGEPTAEEYKQFYPPQLSLNTFLDNCIKSSAQECVFYGDVVRDCYVLNESTAKRIDISAYDSNASLFDKLYRCHVTGRRPSNALLYSDQSVNSCAVKSSKVYECILKETGESVIFNISEHRTACQSKCLSVDNLALDRHGHMAVLRGSPFLSLISCWT